MKFKNLNFEYKLDKEDKTFEGYASTFDNVDLMGDMVKKGAFIDSIENKLPKNQIKVLWQHATPIGKPVHLEEDSKGLFARFQISDTQLGRDAITLMKDNVIDTLSIGYEVDQDSLSPDGKVRYLEKLTLHEFSVVTFPANPEATINNPLKSWGLDPDNLKDFFMSEIKEGRVLSKGNRNTIQNCIKALQEVLDLDNRDKEKSLDPISDLANDMKDYINKYKELKGIE